MSSYWNGGFILEPRLLSTYLLAKEANQILLLPSLKNCSNVLGPTWCCYICLEIFSTHYLLNLQQLVKPIKHQSIPQRGIMIVKMLVSSVLSMHSALFCFSSSIYHQIGSRDCMYMSSEGSKRSLQLEIFWDHVCICWFYCYWWSQLVCRLKLFSWSVQ